MDVGDSQQSVVGRISFGDRCYGGVLVFVPRQQDASALKGTLTSIVIGRADMSLTEIPAHGKAGLAMSAKKGLALKAEGSWNGTPCSSLIECHLLCHRQ